MMPELTHFDAKGAARMVDVSGKPMTARRATKDDREAFEEALSNAIADNAPAAE